MSSLSASLAHLETEINSQAHGSVGRIVVHLGRLIQSMNIKSFARYDVCEFLKTEAAAIDCLWGTVPQTRHRDAGLAWLQAVALRFNESRKTKPSIFFECLDQLAGSKVSAGTTIESLAVIAYVFSIADFSKESPLLRVQASVDHWWVQYSPRTDVTEWKEATFSNRIAMSAEAVGEIELKHSVQYTASRIRPGRNCTIKGLLIERGLEQLTSWLSPTAFFPLLRLADQPDTGDTLVNSSELFRVVGDMFLRCEDASLCKRLITALSQCEQSGAKATTTGNSFSKKLLSVLQEEEIAANLVADHGKERLSPEAYALMCYNFAHDGLCETNYKAWYAAAKVEHQLGHYYDTLHALDKTLKHTHPTLTPVPRSAALIHKQAQKLWEEHCSLMEPPVPTPPKKKRPREHPYTPASAGGSGVRVTRSHGKSYDGKNIRRKLKLA